MSSRQTAVRYEVAASSRRMCCMIERIATCAESFVGILSSVSHRWLDAIQSRAVYDARVRSNSTETLVLIEYGRRHVYLNPPRTCRIALYSMRENRCYQVPEMRHLDAGFSIQPNLATVDGQLYCLRHQVEKNDVYVDVIDLAGQKQWEGKCGRIDVSRVDFVCGALNTKIYVCGGTALQDLLSACVVYDSETDGWSTIAGMNRLRCGHQVTALGGELYAYGMACVDDNVVLEGVEIGDRDGIFAPNVSGHVVLLEVYNPGKNEWRVVEPFGPQIISKRLFVAQGKFHVMSARGIHVLDGSVENNVWTELHSFELPGLPNDEFDCVSVLFVDGELIAGCYFPDDTGEVKVLVIRSKGFGSETKELVWEKAGCPLLFSYPPLMCTIQL